MEIYVYNKRTMEVKSLEQNNLCENIVIIDSDEIKFEMCKVHANGDILKLMKRNVIFKKSKISDEKDAYRIKLRNDKNSQNIEIPKEVISQLIHRLGLIRSVKLKNPVYTVEGFLRELSIDTDQQIILKTKNNYRTLENGEIMTINNIYDNPEMKLWEYQEENKLIFNKIKVE
ncbi:MAG: hypothetical protein WBH44_09395 [Proteocatella sp.]